MPKPLKELLEEYEECLPHGLTGASCVEMARRLRKLDEFVSRGAAREPFWRQHVRRILDGEENPKSPKSRS